MLLSSLRTPIFLSVLLLAACSTEPRREQPATAPHREQPTVAPQARTEPAPKAVSSTPPPAHVEKTETAPVKKVFCPPEPMPKLKSGEYAVWIDSEPEGGIVVVDGKPVGRTPQRVVLNGTARGFCHEDISIKVRFVAADSDHTSQTVEEILTPLDKIPARVRFTTQGAMRVAR